VFDVPDGDGLKLQYSVLSYSENVKTAVVGTEDGSAFAPPPGVFCPPLEHATYRPPPLAEQFSFDIETILEVRRLSSSQQPTVDFFFSVFKDLKNATILVKDEDLVLIHKISYKIYCFLFCFFVCGISLIRLKFLCWS
jgi:hypothetical protein